MTNFEKYGFTLKRKKELKEIDATLYEMEHIKTGAGLIYLDRRGYLLDPQSTECSIIWKTPVSSVGGVGKPIEKVLFSSSRSR